MTSNRSRTDRVGRTGLEPVTLCLKGTCSAIELTARDAILSRAERRGNQRRSAVGGEQSAIGNWRSLTRDRTWPANGSLGRGSMPGAAIELPNRCLWVFGREEAGCVHRRKVADYEAVRQAECPHAVAAIARCLSRPYRSARRFRSLDRGWTGHRESSGLGQVEGHENTTSADVGGRHRPCAQVQIRAGQRPPVPQASPAASLAGDGVGGRQARGTV
jgi:hypothetical protein